MTDFSWVNALIAVPRSQGLQACTYPPKDRKERAMRENEREGSTKGKGGLLLLTTLGGDLRQLNKIQSGGHVLLNGQVINPFDRHFCGNLVTAKHDFSPIFSPLLSDQNRGILNIRTNILNAVQSNITQYNRVQPNHSEILLSLQSGQGVA